MPDVDIEPANAPGAPMFRRLLIANRGEIAVRIARTAADMGMETVVVYSEDDVASGHLRHADITHRLTGAGAYLDGEQLIHAAKVHHCDAVHPGYGFLSENSAFAARCAEEGLIFVGPGPAAIALFGDKTRARDLARDCGVAVTRGSPGATTLDQAGAFFRSLEPGAAMVIKAVAGGGGKGMRVVHEVGQLERAYQRCQSEALRAFGNADVYVERFIQRARHVEVQVIADGEQVSHLWDRECTLQRQHQKLVEFAPSACLDGHQREYILASATRMAHQSGFTNIGTFEFLVDMDRTGQADEIIFLEANPRLQVEHTVTEEILGLDLVRIQLELAAGRTLGELSLTQNVVPAPRGRALQLRINAETLDETGRPSPNSGTITSFAPPGGPGIRVDSCAYAGCTLLPGFDSLLAKLVVNSPGAELDALLGRARRAAREFTIGGVETNLLFLDNLLRHPAVIRNDISTRFVEEHMAQLRPAPEAAAALPGDELPDGAIAVAAPLNGAVSVLNVVVGDAVPGGAELALVEAMKLEYEVLAPTAGMVTEIRVRPGDPVARGEVMVLLEPTGVDSTATAAADSLDLDRIRDDLQLVRERVAATLDSGRPAAVERRRRRGQRTARENIADLCDPDSFIEYGQLAVAYLHARKTDEELRATTPADGFVMGIATVNAGLFGEAGARVAVGSYDATVMAGTQGHKNHQKTDRLFDLAREHAIPLVLFAEGGGGRPREDPVTIAALENTNFRKLAQLSGRVPVVGVVSGRCFAGNAALLGIADVIIATENSNIGMGGPALIEAGGLGSCTPEQVGPIDVQYGNGVVDIRVRDEHEAVRIARQYLAYFQGSLAAWEAPDPRHLRHVVPENRLRAYDVRKVIELLADTGSTLELRGGWGRAYVTAFIRVEGRPVGVIANNPGCNSGAIDSDSADKAARFMRLCDAHGLPLLTLIDTPGIMVGPEAEEKALVRHAARLFVTAASLAVPMFAIVLRKAYGLGAMAAAGGNFKAPFFTIAWPSGELGGMGLEGGVRLAYRKELEAIDNPRERQAFFEERVASRYRKGKASYIASYFEVDAVIDPAESRRWIVRGLLATAESCRGGTPRFIDTW